MSDEDNKIVSIRGGKFKTDEAAPGETTEFQPSPKIMELLDDFVARVKAGKATSIGLCAVTEDGTVTTAFGLVDNDVRFLSAASLLHFRAQGYFFETMQ